MTEQRDRGIYAKTLEKALRKSKLRLHNVIGQVLLLSPEQSAGPYAATVLTSIQSVAWTQSTPLKLYVVPPEAGETLGLLAIQPWKQQFGATMASLISHEGSVIATYRMHKV